MSDIGDLLATQLPPLRRYARQLTRDRSQADDLVQTCLMRALANRHRFRQGSDLRAWLLTILHNQFVSELRRHLREQRRLATANLHAAVSPGSDPELSYRVRELRHALGRLPEAERTIVWQASLTSLGYVDLASSLGIPVGTVGSRLARARESLRALADNPGHRPCSRRRTPRRDHPAAAVRVAGSVQCEIPPVGRERRP